MKNNKVLAKLILYIIFAFLFMIFIIPILINHIYFLNAPFPFMEVDYEINNLLGFYGSVLTFFGTSILGIITVYQNHISQQKTHEINMLTLELQKKSMALAEKTYAEANEEKVPKLEIKINGYGGYHQDLRLIVKNVSADIISNLRSISFEIYDNQSKLLFSIDDVHLSKSSFKPSEEIEARIKTPKLASSDTVKQYGQNIPLPLKDIKLIWKIQCEDIKSRTYYYESIFIIKNTKEMDSSFWKVKRTG